jgi:3-deoxy-D-manno-oct-2-ulosonic acid (Kdo) hydroxylase
MDELTGLIACEGADPAGPWPADAADALEQGSLVHFPALKFELTPGERGLVARGVVVATGKNISLDPGGAAASGLAVDEAGAAQIAAMMRRFCDFARLLALAMAPGYEPTLMTGRTSFRPVEIAGRPVGDWRADDTRLHTDAFPATPVSGKRLLRVFANIDPQAQPRVWRVGGSFEALAAQYLPRIPPPSALHAALLQLRGKTRGRRSPYDHYMLHLHDMAKADPDYQANPCQREVAFAPGVWMVFSDQVPHAAMSGRNALETTFYLPPSAQRHPERSPLRVLERLTGRRLVD